MTLTEASLATRRLAKLLMLGFVGFIFFRTISAIVIPLIPRPSYVTPTPTPNASFGQLAPIKLKPLTITQTTKPGFALDLVATSLPDGPGQANVYPIIQAPYGFLTKDRSQDQARKFYFFHDPQNLGPTDFVWSETNRVMRMSAANLNFTYRYDYNNDSAIFDKSGAFVSKEAAQTLGLEIMKTRGLLGGGSFFGGVRGVDLAQGKIENQLLKFDGVRLIPSQSLAETQAVRLDFFRESLGDYPVVTPRFNEGLVYLTFTGLTDDPGAQKFYQIADLGFIYWVINREGGASYPIIKSLTAWGLFQNYYSQYLVSLVLDDGSVLPDPVPEIISLTAAQSYLAYYDSDEAQDYIQPVWVFTGKASLSGGKTADWVGYVPAIEEQWIKK